MVIFLLSMIFLGPVPTLMIVITPIALGVKVLISK